MEERATVRGQPARSRAESTPPLAHTLRDFRAPQQPSRLDLRLVAGYELLEEIGQGGMGVVWKARQVQLDRVVALKMLPTRRASRDDLVRFRTEAEAVARLIHPGIVQIHEIGEHDGQPFFSLEYVPGGSLDRHLGGKPMTEAAAARLVRALAEAVEHAHRHGIVHRDLKPANVLLASPVASAPGAGRALTSRPPPGADATGLAGAVPKIADFGLAKKLDRDAGQTRAGEVIGTPSYMAPEQAEGRKDLGPAADIWSLGAILYECLTGRPPFVAGSVVETLEQVRKHDPPPPRGLSPGLARDLEIICLKCLEKAPPRRFPSAQALADDLGRFLEGRPILARPVGRAERALKWARRRPTAAALLAVSLLLVAFVVTAVPVQNYRLQLQVREISAEMLLAQRKALRESCESKLGEGAAHLKRGKLKDVERAIVRFATVQEAISDDDADLDPELHRLRDEAKRLRGRASAELERLLGAGPARAKAREFLTLRDEAFFQLYHDLLGAPDAARPRACLRLCQQALDIFPMVDCLECDYADRLRSARCEVLLLKAEAHARLADRKQLREALRWLDLAAEGEALSHGAHLRRARYLELLGDSDAAAKERSLAGKAPSRSALDWFLRGQERWLAGDVRAALSDLDHALDLEPDLFWARLLSGVGREKLGQNSQARAEFSLCVRARPNFAWPYLLRAYLAVRMKDLDAAARDLDEAEGLKLDAGARYALWIHRGVLALSRGNKRLAASEFQRAIFHSPRHPHGHANLAQVLWKSGDLSRARAALEHALRLAPDDVDLARTRVRLVLAQGDTSAALAALDGALAASARQAGTRHRLALLREKARLLYQLRRHAESLPACRQALEAKPDDPVALRLHAEVLLELGQYREALAAFQAYLKVGKPDLDLYRRRAKARAGAGDLAGVVEDCTLALTLSREPGLYNARGWAHLVSGTSRQALRDFESALELAPDDAEALIGRGSAHLELNDVKTALTSVEAGLKRRPAQPRVLYHAARTFARASGPSGRPSREQEKRAVEVLRQTLEAMPAPDRPRFLRDQVRRDEAFRSLAARGELRGVEAQFGQSPLPKSEN